MDVKEAVERAAKYLKELIPSAQSIQLEEVEEVDADQYWAVTLSYDDTTTLFGSRNYKILKVRKADGEVVSMKIRTIR